MEWDAIDLLYIAAGAQGAPVTARATIILTDSTTTAAAVTRSGQHVKVPVV